MTLWQILTAYFKDGPDELAFRAICSLIDTWPHQDEVFETWPLIEEEFAHWPNEARTVPWTWAEAVQSGEIPVSWPLVRGIDLAKRPWGADDTSLQAFLETQQAQHLAELRLYGDTEDITLLVNNAEHLSQLRSIDNLSFDVNEQRQAFLASPLIDHLHTLAVYSFGFDKRSSPQVHGFSRAAEHLSTLELSLPISFDIQPLLVQEKLPALRTLVLAPEWYGFFAENQPPDHFLQVAHLPLLTQLERLDIHDGSVPVLTALAHRQDLTLQHMGIRGRHYMRNLVDYQQFARRIDKETVTLLAQNRALKGLTSLHISQERVGDCVLEILASTTPGHLKTLALVDVGLTDEGAEQLAQMPHLKGIRHLTLRSNPDLTAKGLTALFASPYLESLQSLSLGADLGNPYYGGSDDRIQRYGAALAKTLIPCKALAYLESLTITLGALDEEAVRILAQLDLPHLRRLNLSQNPIGSKGLQALLEAQFVPHVHQLLADICSLDDAAILALTQAPFKQLRDLSLAYNAIGNDGAKVLANSETLSTLWRLNLHDNVITDAGLLDLAQSIHLKNLIELDVEQDVWNYRAVHFKDETAGIMARTTTLQHLDVLRGGIVDEYHGDRATGLFSNVGTSLIQHSHRLRGPARRGLQVTDSATDETESEPVNLPPWLTSEARDQQRREQDFRHHPRTSLTEAD